MIFTKMVLCYKFQVEDHNDIQRPTLQQKQTAIDGQFIFELLHTKIRWPVSLYAVKTVEHDFRIRGQTDNENPNRVIMFYMVVT